MAEEILKIFTFMTACFIAAVICEFILFLPAYQPIIPMVGGMRQQ